MNVLRTLVFLASWAGCLRATPSQTTVDTGPTYCTSARFWAFQQTAAGDPCLEWLDLTVECKYWSDYIAHAVDEDPGPCSPVEWTAVHDGQCVRVSITCPGDPRDPDFLDCSRLPGVCPTPPGSEEIHDTA